MANAEKSKAELLIVIFILGLLAYGLGASFFAYSWSPGPNYRNVTVDSKVNITGSAPVIQRIFLQNPITLNAGSMTEITCNVSIRDYNGFQDFSVASGGNVNATLFHYSSSEGAADNNNTHYTNSSCTPIAGEQSGSYANYTCGFQVNYYALNGTWNCTARVNDTINLKGFATNSTSISALYALNVTPLVDYGNISMGDYSNNISVNITNLGNRNINITVRGYARNMGDGYSFVCDQGNFTIGLQHFAANSTADYAAKQALGSNAQAIWGLTVNKTANADYSLNTTYWEFYADPNQVAYGNCTGYLIFHANAEN